MTLAELHEGLLAWATAEPRKPQLLAARAEHFGRSGEPHEEDGSFERRMNAMLDYYLYDWRPSSDAPSVVEQYLAAEGASLPAGWAEAYRALGGNRHGLFEVRKLEEGLIRLRDVFTGQDLDVTERRQVAGMAKGDLLEARLLPVEGQLVFSGAFLYHPREVRKRILGEVKKIRKAAGKTGTPDVAAFLARLSRMAFKLERYRNVRLESIYDFELDERTMTPRPAPKP
jgi:hypothetical protein